MKTTGLFSRSTRLEKSIAELEAELADKNIAPLDVATDFIHTTDSANFEERLNQLSPALRELIVNRAKDNVCTFDSIIENTIERQGYPGGWIAMRDWARRQPWHDENVARVSAIIARNKRLDESKEQGLSFSEQGSILGLLRVERMRATSDDEREALTKKIAELEAEFRAANRGV